MIGLCKNCRGFPKTSQIRKNYSNMLQALAATPTLLNDVPYHYFRTNVSFALHCLVLEQILAWRISTPTRSISHCDPHSLSVPSNPSLNDCAVSSTELPPPDGPKAAKCCAWSMTSVKRPRKVWDVLSDPCLSRSCRGYTHTSVKIFDIPSPCSSFNLLGCLQYSPLGGAVGEHLHIHNHFTKAIPEPPCSHKSRQSNTAGLCLECVSYSGAKGNWDVEICPIP